MVSREIFYMKTRQKAPYFNGTMHAVLKPFHFHLVTHPNSAEIFSGKTSANMLWAGAKI